MPARSNNCSLPDCRRISKSRDREHYIFLSSAYKQTDAVNMCDRRRHLCLTNGIHIHSGCFLSDGREIYNAPYPGNLKYTSTPTNYNLSMQTDRCLRLILASCTCPAFRLDFPGSHQRTLCQRRTDQLINKHTEQYYISYNSTVG